MRGAAGEDVHFTAEMARELDQQVGRGTESIEPEAIAFLNSAEPIRAVANDSCAEQRGSMFVGKYFWNQVSEVFADTGELRVASVDVIAGEASVIAEIFETTLAV